LNQPATAVLVSGGLDSCILLAHLSVAQQVTPIYVHSGHAWETQELAALKRFIQAFKKQQATASIGSIREFKLPVADVYADHWSTTGQSVPPAGTSDEAVFLPGRNMLLCLKAALWCQLNGVGQLATGVLRGNPFADASPEFFAAAQAMLNVSGLPRIQLIQPLAQKTKAEVMTLGAAMPLEHTFSCLAPHGNLHCGGCNKCDERKRAFKTLNADPTSYASAPGVLSAAGPE